MPRVVVLAGETAAAPEGVDEGRAFLLELGPERHDGGLDEGPTGVGKLGHFTVRPVGGSLCDTPARIAKMYVNEIFGGLDYRKFPKITAIENKMQIDQPVQVSDISLTSTCEHHFVTIDGTATVSYIPKDTVIGLSKINRLVGFFAQRPQVQERLTQQVLVALQTLTNTEDVAVSINATHYCVKARGIRDTNSYTKTSALGGRFLTDNELKREFFR